MKLAVASGKGGTGKTTVAVSLALSARGEVRLLDCDVEEPNAGLFLARNRAREEAVTVPVPVIDEKACTACGACAPFCEFNAIVHVGSTVLVFPELCHSCGGCALVCPSKAITEAPSTIGTLTESDVARDGLLNLPFYQGLLSIGKAMSPPVIRAVKERAERDDSKDRPSTGETLTIIDAPPGTSCPMGAAVTGVDFVVLVTEPTPFGLHDLDLAVKTVRNMGIPFGVIVNRSDSGDDRAVRYCEREGIEIMMQIPEDSRIARGYSEGKALVVSAPEYRNAFAALAERIMNGYRGGEGRRDGTGASEK